jgi:hypothetical protein
MWPVRNGTTASSGGASGVGPMGRRTIPAAPPLIALLPPRTSPGLRSRFEV